MKYLKFYNEHVSRILRGEKVLTVRLNLDRRIKEGDEVELRDGDNVAFATAKIADRKKITARSFVDSRINGHKTYNTFSSFEHEMNKYYPNKDILPWTELDIVWWKEVNPID